MASAAHKWTRVVVLLVVLTQLAACKKDDLDGVPNNSGNEAIGYQESVPLVLETNGWKSIFSMDDAAIEENDWIFTEAFFAGELDGNIYLSAYDLATYTQGGNGGYGNYFTCKFDNDRLLELMPYMDGIQAGDKEEFFGSDFPLGCGLDLEKYTRGGKEPYLDKVGFMTVSSRAPHIPVTSSYFSYEFFCIKDKKSVSISDNLDVVGTGFLPDVRMRNMPIVAFYRKGGETETHAYATDSMFVSQDTMVNGFHYAGLSGAIMPSTGNPLVWGTAEYILNGVSHDLLQVHRPTNNPVITPQYYGDQTIIMTVNYDNVRKLELVASLPIAPSFGYYRSDFTLHSNTFTYDDNTFYMLVTNRQTSVDGGGIFSVFKYDLASQQLSIVYDVQPIPTMVRSLDNVIVGPRGEVYFMGYEVSSNSTRTEHVMVYENGTFTDITPELDVTIDDNYPFYRIADMAVYSNHLYLCVYTTTFDESINGYKLNVVRREL